MSDYPDNPGPLPAEKLCNKFDPNPVEGLGPLGNESSGRMHYSGSDRKDQVIKLQNMLLAMGYDLGSTGDNGDGADGIFGRKTEEAVIDFQQKNKDWNGEQLEAEGLVGPETSDALNRKMVGMWYDQYQTPIELTESIPYYTVTPELLKSGLDLELNGGVEAKVFVAGVVENTVWSATWERAEEPVKMRDHRRMLLSAPGIRAGTPVKFVVYRECDGACVQVAELTALSREDRAETIFADWFRPDYVASYIESKTDSPQPFPAVAFLFEAEGNGRAARSEALEYRDKLHAHIFSRSGEDREELRNTPCTFYSPWGRWDTTTDEQGFITLENVPPGGGSLAINGTIVHLEPEERMVD